MRGWLGGLCVLCAALTTVGCKKREPPPPAVTTNRTAGGAASRPSTVRVPDLFGMGAVATSAKPGDFVLCPPREWIDKAEEKGNPGEQTFIFYGAHMIKPGAALSTVKALSGKKMAIPNHMIVPIRRGESAAPGDIVLTVWQSGSGMQRAIVVEGGTATRPVVRYLDVAPDNPSGAGTQAEPCRPDTFHKLTGPWQPGTSVAAKGHFGHRRWRIITATKDRVLGLGHAGKMMLLARKDCTPVPPVQEVTAGTGVQVPHLGSYVAGRVIRVDPAIGRVFVEIELAGQKKEIAAPVVDVLTVSPP